MGQERFRAIHHAPEVDVHQPLEIFVAHALDGARKRDAGVVEDQIDLAVVVRHRIRPCVDGIAVRNIDALRRHSNVGASRLAHGLLQPLCVDVGQSDMTLPTYQL